MSQSSYKPSLLVLLSGDSQRIAAQLENQCSISSLNIEPMDEKSIAKVKSMLALVRSQQKRELICFGCKDLTLQRYQVLLKSYLLVARARQRFLVDETGTAIRFSLATYFFLDIPRLIVELLASAAVVLSTSVRLMVLRQSASERR
ncbi:MAG TPA: hypothetical protein VII11_03845 [Bacteroidota bacterium]